MRFAVYSIGGTAALFVGMLALLAFGRWLGLRDRQPEAGTKESMGAIDGALLGLLSLVLAFTFSSAAERFDARRDLIIDETNAIVTAYLRLDLLPADAQPTLREDFKQYIDSRLAAYDALPNVEAAFRELDRAKLLQQQIWRDAMTALQSQPVAPPVTMLVVQGVNAMIDLGAKQIMTARKHPPFVIFAMLAVLSLVGAGVIGYATALTKRWWLHAIAFSVLFCVTFFVILELEYPRLGYIQITDFDRDLRALRQSLP
jgi:hypothetical protein